MTDDVAEVLAEPTRVLLVDDDARIRQALGLALSDEGFQVTAVGSGEAALASIRGGGHELVLLDVMLPDMDGIAVCRRARLIGDIPIIMITARSDTPDVIGGLEAGADDYVTKPIVAAELAARMRALLRRRRPDRAASDLSVGGLDIRPDDGTVRRGDAQVHLTRTEMGLLVELAMAGGRVVSREDLLRRVWGYDYFGDTRLLDVHVRRLRRKVEPDPDRPTTILTVRGSGYLLAQS